MTKFAALFDIHYGHERRNGHKVPLHDLKAFGATYAFLQDFKPDVIILGGDILDCNPISHHNKGKPGRTEGLRLASDAQGCREDIITPLEALKATKNVYILGNHEDWLSDLAEDQPGLEGLVDAKHLLSLNKWQVEPQGGRFRLGKLWFMHGDTLGGGANVTRKAVTDGGRSLRFGHFHTYAATTKVSFLDENCGHTAVAVPCLCGREPKYGQGRGNSWVQGFNWGYVNSDGTFSDYVSVITNGKFAANGKVYRG